MGTPIISTTFSGKEGKVAITASDIAHVTSWNMAMSDTAPTWNDSSTGGYNTRKSGVKDTTGTVEGKYDQDDPIEQRLGVGSLVTLKLYQRPTRFISVPAMITKLTLNEDINTGEIHSWTAEYGGTAAPVFP